MKLLKYSNFFLLLFIFLFISCSEENPIEVEEPQKERGEIITSNLITEFPVEIINQFFTIINNQSGLNLNFNAVYSVKIYKITYQTIDANNNPTIASGSIFFTNDISNLPTLSAHHGTQTKRANVGSVNPANAPEGLIGGTLGYFTIVPDYLGLGESTILHPYLHAKSSATCVIDLLRASKKFAEQENITLKNQLFLAGYSEGGFVTMAAHKEIQSNYSDEFFVTASAPMAGSYDMNLTAKSIIQTNTYNEPSFAAFLMYSYNEIYKWNNLNNIFQPQYSGLMNTLFDGFKTTDEINGFLTNNISDLFKPEFATNFLSGNNSQFISALTENSLLDWTPLVPMKLFHGTADEYVPFQNSVSAKSSFEARGAVNIDVIPIEGGTHLSSVFPSLLGAITWFEQIRNSTVAMAQ